MRLAGGPLWVHTGGVELDRSRPAVILIHAAGMDHTVWRYQSRALAGAGCAVAAVDLPAHGRSGGDPCKSIEEMAAVVAEMAAGLELQPAVVAGHSLGGLVALQLAAAYPQAVRSLVLLGSSGEMRVHPDLLAAADADDHLAAELITAWSFPAMALGGEPQPGSWEVGATLRLLERSRPGVLAADLHACHDFDGLAVAARVRCPATVVIGGQDRMAPPLAARRLADALPQGRRIELPDAGHMTPLERPRQVRDLLLEEAHRHREAAEALT